MNEKQTKLDRSKNILISIFPILFVYSFEFFIGFYQYFVHNLLTDHLVKTEHSCAAIQI